MRNFLLSTVEDTSILRGLLIQIIMTHIPLHSTTLVLCNMIKLILLCDSQDDET